MYSKSVVAKEAFEFAVKIVKESNQLTQSRQFALANQIIRSGTSVGANIQEGLGGQSTKDFIAKFHIALKEALETRYWLRLLIESGHLDRERGMNLIVDCNRIISMLSRTIKTMKSKL